jgi:uncharacterized membrane protein YphA (DoxX/SURF4 family)
MKSVLAHPFPMNCRSMTGWVARWVLGICFVYLGLNKAWNPTDFLKAVHQYGWVDQTLFLTWIAALLPWLEVFCRLLLLVGFWVRGAAFVVFGMLVFFSGIILHRALRIHETTGIDFCEIRFDCGCGNGAVLVCRKLVENALLTALSLALVLSRKR